MNGHLSYLIFKGGQMLQGEEIEGLILQAIRWILEGELRFLINKNFLGEWCVRMWKTSSVLVRTPWRYMKVAKTLIESMPCKGDFHAEKNARMEFCVSICSSISTGRARTLWYIWNLLVTMIRFGILSVRKDILIRLSMSSFLDSL